MNKVFFDVVVSLDGFIAGENRGPHNPLGDGGTSLHRWMFRQKAFWERHGRPGGEVDDADGRLIDKVFDRTGAYIMGKRMFEEGAVVWPEDLFKAPVFVLTHEKRDPWIQQGATAFYFINDGIESALEKAKRAANAKDIYIQGGAHNIQQYLEAGAIDEFTLHIVPILLGSGVRLFEHLHKNYWEARISSAQHSEYATHVTYEIIRR